VPENIHGAARLVATLWPLQSSLPAAGMGVSARIRNLGTIGSRCQRSRPITGPVHCEALVPAAVSGGDSSVTQAVAGRGGNTLRSPTILTWDWSAISRILPVEANRS
jgi:hypothetical protein